MPGQQTASNAATILRLMEGLKKCQSAKKDFVSAETLIKNRTETETAVSAKTRATVSAETVVSVVDYSFLIKINEF